MCLSIPGKVVEIKEDKIIIDYGSEKREATNSVVDIKIGDYVIINNKVIINKLEENEAKRFLEIINA